jgi:hypothetical protein
LSKSQITNLKGKPDEVSIQKGLEVWEYSNAKHRHLKEPKSWYYTQYFFKKGLLVKFIFGIFD